MQAFKICIAGAILLLPVLLPSCKKDTQIVKDVTIENVIYGVNDVPIYSSNAEKTKQKNSSQYISIVYSDLFNKSIGGNELNDLSELSLAIGDKQLANEMIIDNYMNSSQVNVPAKTEMLNDVDAFIENTYVRFYARKPTELEKYYFKDIIQKDSNITPEIIYTSFTASNEYRFY